LMKCQWISQR